VGRLLLDFSAASATENTGMTAFTLASSAAANCALTSAYTRTGLHMRPSVGCLCVRSALNLASILRTALTKLFDGVLEPSTSTGGAAEEESA
jgi:hypothetical protein